MFTKLQTQRNQVNIQSTYLQKFGNQCLLKMEQIAVKYNHFESIMNEPMEIFLPKVQSIVSIYEIIAYEIYDSCEACSFSELGHSIVKMNTQMQSVIKWVLTNLTRKNRKSKNSILSKAKTPRSSIFQDRISENYFKNKEIKLHKIKSLAKNIDNQLNTEDPCTKDLSSQSLIELQSHQQQNKQQIMKTNSSDARILISEALNYFEKKSETTDRFVLLKQNYLNDPLYSDINYHFKQPHHINHELDCLNKQRTKKIKELAQKFVKEINQSGQKTSQYNLQEQGIQVELQRRNTSQINNLKKQIKDLKDKISHYHKQKQTLKVQISNIKDKYHKLQQNYYNLQKSRYKKDHILSNKQKQQQLKSSQLTISDFNGDKISERSHNQQLPSQDKNKDFQNLNIPNYEQDKCLDYLLEMGTIMKKKSRKRWTNTSKLNKQFSMINNQKKKTWFGDMATVQIDNQQNLTQIKQENRMNFWSQIVKICIQPNNKQLKKQNCINLVISQSSTALNAKLQSRNKTCIPSNLGTSQNSPKILNSFKLIQFDQHQQSLIGKSINKLASEISSKNISNQRKITEEFQTKKLNTSAFGKNNKKKSKCSIIRIQDAQKNYNRKKQSVFIESRLRDPCNFAQSQTEIVTTKLLNKQIIQNPFIIVIHQLYQKQIQKIDQLAQIWSSIHLQTKFKHTNLIINQQILQNIFITAKNAQNVQYMHLSDTNNKHKKVGYSNPKSTRHRYVHSNNNTEQILKNITNIHTSRSPNEKPKQIYQCVQIITNLIYRRLLSLSKRGKTQKIYFMHYWLFLKYPYSSVMKKSDKKWLQNIKQLIDNLDKLTQIQELGINSNILTKILERILSFHRQCPLNCQFDGNTKYKFCIHIAILIGLFGVHVKM